MFSNLKVVCLGNYVKLTSVNLKTSNRISALSNNINQKKLENNIIRAKNKINDIALANDFQYFFTLTFSPKFDRYDLYYLLNKFRSYLRVMRDSGNFCLKYLIVPEQHKDGAWHFHGFFTSDISNFIYCNEYGHASIREFDGLGFCNIQIIQDKLRVSSYVTKYVSKNLANGISKYRNSYFCSTGLSRGELICDKLYDNEFFNEHFFDFSNDFCRRKIISKEEYNKFKFLIDSLC